MNRQNCINHWGRRFPFRLGLLALVCIWFVTPKVALAHPLDVYLQASYITVAPTQIMVELDLTPGVLVAPVILPQLDPDGDEQITAAEGRAYVAALLEDVVLQVDGKELALTIDKIYLPAYINVQAGYGTIRVFTTAALAADLTGTHQLVYANNYAPTGSAYQVNAFVDNSVPVTLGQMAREGNQQRATMDFVIESAAPTAGAVAAPANGEATVPTVPTETGANRTTAAADVASAFGLDTNAAGQANKLMAFLYAPMLTPWVLLVALALALLLGGLHALTPGHGKTLVAAYLIGSRGTVRHAVALGAIVTFTHTASVIVIGLLALFASQYIVPGVLVPALTFFSGLLVVSLGVRLIWQRWIAFRSGRNQPHAHGDAHDTGHHHEQDHAHSHDHSHDHNHDHSHDHSHGQALTHHHGDGHVHTHLPPAEGITPSSLLAMGVSGGLVPCPEALGIMVIAIGLNRILLGLGLIVFFSFGLAAVLILIGILLVRSRSLLERVGGFSSRWSRALPLASAVIITVLGIGIMLSGLVVYVG